MNKLSDNIWITRKCHINAEKRLNRWSLMANVILTAYSFYLITASVIAIRLTLPRFEVVSLIGSVLLLTASVFTWGLRYPERAAQFKASYVRLYLLVDEAQAAEARNDAPELARLAKTYGDVLLGCENHSQRDYLALRYSMKGSRNTTLESFGLMDYVVYFSGTVLGMLVRVLLLAGPLIGLYWYVRGAQP
jgi:hypothetical protein